MKRRIHSIAVLLFSIIFLNTSINAGNKIKISDTKVNLDDLVIEIYGKKFTPDLKVKLDNSDLEILESNDTYIKARLWDGIEEGSHRLILATQEQLVDAKKDPFFEVFIGEMSPKKPKEVKEGEISDGADSPEGVQSDKGEKEVKKPE